MEINQQLYLDRVCRERTENAEHPLRLEAIIKHIGDTMDHGHYVAHVRTPHDTWRTYNDSVVNMTTFEDLRSANINTDACVLLYQRINPNDN